MEFLHFRQALPIRTSLLNQVCRAMDTIRERYLWKVYIWKIIFPNIRKSLILYPDMYLFS
jgi:hypothetical protein